MKKKIILSALLLPGMFMMALVLSTNTTVYGKAGNEVNVGEADSHLKVKSSKESQATKSGAAAIDKSTIVRQPGEVTDEEQQRQLQPNKQPINDLAPAGQGADDPSLPQHMDREKEKHKVKDSQTHKEGSS